MTRTIGERRAAAAEACKLRFVGKTYDLRANRDCIKLIGHSAHKLGKRISLLKGLRYTTEAGALKAMRQLGFASLIEAADATGLPRIAPAMARPGDWIALKAGDENPFGCAMSVAFDNGRVIGFVDSVGVGAICRVVDPDAYLGAWRVA